jgi:putative two-component system response regulator
MRDDNTGAHVVRVGCYSALLAEKLGLSDHEVRTIYHAAPLHDVGKIGIPDRILMKRGKLSHEEFEIVKTHTTLGSKILADTDIVVLQLAQQVALCHHERWDGKGYPQGLSADKIPVAARIVAVADAFDAITSDRPYGKKSTFSTACEIIKREQDKQFDPAVTEVLMSNMEGMIQITALVDRGYHVVPLNCILNGNDQANSKRSD